MGKLQEQLSVDNDCWHNARAAGSSLGALMVNGFKVYFKELDRASMMTSENEAMNTLRNSLSNAVAESGAAITIVLDNGRQLDNPIDVVKTSGNPKSDFSIVNHYGDSIHVSHKKGFKPSHFQQWSGCSDAQISNNRYCLEFQNEMKKRYKEIPPAHSVVFMTPDDEDSRNLKKLSVYGLDSLNQSLVSGAEKVDCVLQGVPTLQHVGKGKYRLTTDVDHVTCYPELPKGDYDPVLTMIYKGDRSSFGIVGARASIYPLAGRNFKEIIDVR